MSSTDSSGGQEYRFHFPLPNGLHARPASHLQELADHFQSAITLVNERTGYAANAKSVLSLVGADVKTGDPCKMIFSGSDEGLAHNEVTTYLCGDFLRCDEALPPTQELPGSVFIPRSLRKAGLEAHHAGIPLCRGIGWGTVVRIGGLTLPTSLKNEKAGEPAKEEASLRQSIQDVGCALEKKIAASSNQQESEVLKAHLGILHDSEFDTKLRELILEEKLTAGQAIIAAGEHFMALLQNAQSSYLRERVLDIQDICSQLLKSTYGAHPGTEEVTLTQPSIVVAESLTPGQFLSLDRSQLQALVLGHAGATSHAVILARSFGIPTLAGLGTAAALLQAGKEIIVDANRGIVIPEIKEPISSFYRRELSKAGRIREAMSSLSSLETATADGNRLEIAANIASVAEVAPAFESGAEGIGLFRTEMIFMDRDAAPTEEEQANIYTAVVQASAGRSVIIRTVDIGGDKPVSYLGLPPEVNPFLGYRGVRIYKEFASLIKTQLRAILRAAEHGAVRLLVPMVSSVEEVRHVKALITESREELRAVGSSAADACIEFGIMLEVPAVAFQMPNLCEEVDFFSIGTNDLTQYWMAADRDNAKVAPLYNSIHPSFLRLLKTLVDAAHAKGKWIGMCGEMAENATLLPLLIGLGFDELSMAPPRIPAIKAGVRKAKFRECAELAEQVLTSSVAAEVMEHLDRFEKSGESLPIVSPGLVLLHSEAVTKEEAIRELVNVLEIENRTTAPDTLEEEIWNREDTYSTGFGGGFAIPHCKSAHLSANTIAILRCRKEGPGIEWGSLDGAPVHIVILLAIREANSGKEHLKILSTLSRQVMRDEFRDQLRSQDTPEAIAQFITAGLFA